MVEASAASSTKTVSVNGDSHVTTTAASSSSCKAPPPIEPTFTLTFEPRAVGITCKVTAVCKVVKGSQAEEKGVRVGDLVLTVGGRKVETAKEVTEALGEGKKGGDTGKKSYDVVFRREEKGLKGVNVEGKAAAAPQPAAAAAEATAEADSEAADSKAAAEAAAETARKLSAGTGEVTLHYNMYSEKFNISAGSLLASLIDEEYCLSDVMPGCLVRLSRVKTDTKGSTLQHPELLDLASINNESPYVSEAPAGTFLELEKDKEYWVFVVEDPIQEAKDRAAMDLVVAAAASGAEPRSEYAEAGLPESCSCIEGNPCVDEYGCKNWHERYRVAKENGWKGFDQY